MSRPEITVGQVYASTHKGDIHHGCRQRRIVVDVNTSFVWLKTQDRGSTPFDGPPPTRVRLRGVRDGYVIPGHRLVEDPS